jgi:hypothetical protein
MQIKLIQSIRANGKQHRPPSVVDTKAIGISDAEAEVLVRSGVAVIVAEAVAETTEAAEQTTEAQAEAEPEPAPAKPAKKR